MVPVFFSITRRHTRLPRSSVSMTCPSWRRWAGEHGSANARWFANHDLNQWADTPEREALWPIRRIFRHRSSPLVAAEHDGQIYLLLYT